MIFKNIHQGFSLLETTVAIGVLALAIIGPLTLAASSLKTASVAKNNLIASMLAQEGIELVRNYRAKNVLAEQNWLTGLSSCNSGAGCIIDPQTLELSVCGPTCPYLNFDNSSGVFGYNTGGTNVQTIFTRSIRIDSLSAYEAKFLVTISWPDRFGPKTFSLEEYALDWK